MHQGSDEGRDACDLLIQAPVKDGLLEHAEHWNADLIVTGTRARSRMARYVLGDNSMHLIRHAQRPLYITY